MGSKKPQREQLPIAGMGKRPMGANERAARAAIARAQRDGDLNAETDAGPAAIARTLARLLDEAAAESDKWAAAKLAAELRTTYAALGLSADPAARGKGGDDAHAWMSSLGQPTPGATA